MKRHPYGKQSRCVSQRVTDPSFVLVATVLHLLLVLFDSKDHLGRNYSVFFLCYLMAQHNKGLFIPAYLDCFCCCLNCFILTTQTQSFQKIGALNFVPGS